MSNGATKNLFRRFVKRLIDLTDEDVLNWSRMLTTDSCIYDGQAVAVEWLPDDKPSLVLQAESIEGYNYKIQALLNAIDRYYKRNKLYEYSDEERSRRSEHMASAQQEERDRLRELSTNIERFLKQKRKK